VRLSSTTMPQRAVRSTASFWCLALLSVLGGHHDATPHSVAPKFAPCWLHSLLEPSGGCNHVSPIRKAAAMCQHGHAARKGLSGSDRAGRLRHPPSAHFDKYFSSRQFGLAAPPHNNRHLETFQLPLRALMWWRGGVEPHRHGLHGQFSSGLCGLRTDKKLLGTFAGLVQDQRLNQDQGHSIQGFKTRKGHARRIQVKIFLPERVPACWLLLLLVQPTFSFTASTLSPAHRHSKRAMPLSAVKPTSSGNFAAAEALSFCRSSPYAVVATIWPTAAASQVDVARDWLVKSGAEVTYESEVDIQQAAGPLACMALYHGEDWLQTNCWYMESPLPGGPPEAPWAGAKWKSQLAFSKSCSM